MRITLAAIAAILIAAFGFAPVASAASRTAELDGTTPFEWTGPTALSIDPGGEADVPCTIPLNPCDETLIRLKVPGELTLDLDNASSSADFDLRVYASDASGTRNGEFVAESAASFGDDEHIAIAEPTSEYYLVEVAYYFSLPVDTYKVTANLTPAAFASSRITGLRARVAASKLKRIAGTATAVGDAEVSRVEVALVRQAGDSCTSLGANGRFKGSPKDDTGAGCAPTTWIKAKGTRRWSLKLRRKLAKGSYVAFSRATDSSGNTEPVNAPELGNQVAFSVR